LRRAWDYFRPSASVLPRSAKSSRISSLFSSLANTRIPLLQNPSLQFEAGQPTANAHPPPDDLGLSEIGEAGEVNGRPQQYKKYLCNSIETRSVVRPAVL